MPAHIGVHPHGIFVLCVEAGAVVLWYAIFAVLTHRYRGDGFGRKKNIHTTRSFAFETIGWAGAPVLLSVIIALDWWWRRH